MEATVQRQDASLVNRVAVRGAQAPAALVLAVREPHMYYQTVDYYLPDGTPVLSLQAYLDRRAAGALDRSREYWLFHDEMIADRLAFFRTIPLPWRSGRNLHFGRLTVARLDPDALAGAPRRRE